MCFFSECWDSEPDNRPDMNQVVYRLKAMISKTTMTKRHSTNEQKQDLGSDNVNASSNFFYSIFGFNKSKKNSTTTSIKIGRASCRERV